MEILCTPNLLQTSIANIEAVKNGILGRVSLNTGRKNSVLVIGQLHAHKKCRTGLRSRQASSKDSIQIHRVGVFNAAQSTSEEEVHAVLQMTSNSEKKPTGSSFLFRTEFDDLVKVSVGVKETKYTVYIEVETLQQSLINHNLILCWGMFRDDSSQLRGPDSGIFVPFITEFKSQGSEHPMKSPFARDSSCSHMIGLDFDCSYIPFYLSFLLQSDGTGNKSQIRTHRKTNFCVPVGLGRGYAMPLGVSSSNDGSVNFSLFSRNARGVVLCLYENKSIDPSLEVELDPYVNRTGDIWHVSMDNIANYVSYGYRHKGENFGDRGYRFHAHDVLLDPYSKMIRNFCCSQADSPSVTKSLGCLSNEANFQWCGDKHPYVLMEKLVVYRLNVDQFTKSKSSGLPENVTGTFAGLIKKLPHLINLGVNALLLEPIFSFDVERGSYFPYHFFSPMSTYGDKDESISCENSMKDMVKALHAQGVEVLLEVPFTHTCKGGDAYSQAISFGGIDNSSYYFIGGNVDSETCRVLKCNDPILEKMILDCLHYWVTEFHVDGFCFINSSSLLRGSNSDQLSRPPLVESIALDPILSNTKIISDCWSPVDMSYKDVTFPHWQRWAEMNSKYFHDIRNFLRGKGLLRDLATRLCGSGDVFTALRGPTHSFNFITKNAGLTLVDLVSFSDGELASELSWNCGVEGPTDKKSVLEIRLRQVRNFLFILFISLGVPVMNMGDEFGYSTGGSASYTNRNPIDWNSLTTEFSIQMTTFISFLTTFRNRRNDLFQRKNFLKVENISWQGSDRLPPKWEDPSCKFLSLELKAEKDAGSARSYNGNLFISFNASDLPELATLPELTEEYVWFLLVDTSLPYPYFFSSDSDSQNNGELCSYELQPHTCAMFEAKVLNL